VSKPLLKPFLVDFLRKAKDPNSTAAPDCAIVYGKDDIHAQSVITGYSECQAASKITGISRAALRTMKVLFPPDATAAEVAEYVVAPGAAKKKAGRPPAKPRINDGEQSELGSSNQVEG
jgi:hypothetical protein